MKTQIVLGKNHESISRDFLIQEAKKFKAVTVDIGAGDGKGSLRFARRNPSVLVVAIDSSFTALEKVAVASNKKPSRGGVDNLICLYGNIRNSSNELQGLADKVRVFLPWGDLLEGIASRDEEMVGAIATCAKVGADIEIVINAEIWKDNLPKNLAHLGEMTPEFFLANHKDFVGLGIEIQNTYEMTLEDIKNLDTTWTQKLMSSRNMAKFIMAKGVRI